MRMFDDPKKELEWLHHQLLEEEEAELEEMVEEFGEEDYEDFFQEDYHEEYSRAPYRRNSGNGGQVRNFSNGYRGEALLCEEESPDWDDENDEPDNAVYYETRRDRRRRRRRERAAKKAGKKQNTLGLKLLLVLETMIILAILVWLVMNR